MAGDHTSHARIEVDVNDRDAIAALENVRREYRETMAAIDKEEATATVRADTKPLERSVKEASAKIHELENDDVTVTLRGDLEKLDRDLEAAKRKLKRLRADKANIPVGADTKELDKDIAKVRAEIARLDSEKAEVKVVVDDADRAIKELRRVRDANQKNLSKMESDNAKAEKAAASRDDRRLKADRKLEMSEERIASSSEKRMERLARAEERKSERSAKAMLREQSMAERAAARRTKEINDVPKLEAAYMRLGDKLERLQKIQGKAHSDEGKFRAGVLVRETEAAMHGIRDEVRRRVGRDPITMPVRLSLAERAGRDLRAALDRNFIKRGTFLGAAMGAGASFGKTMAGGAVRLFRRESERGFVQTFKDLGKLAVRGGRGLRSGLAAGISGVGGKILKGLEGLSDMTVRLGPFTSSIRGVVIGLSLLGPIIVDVVAALGSLVSVAGAAALGVGALGLGLAGGAIPAMLGVGLVVKGMVTDFQNAQKAQKKYSDAVLKNGENSKQAKKALDEMRHVMGGVSTATAKTFANWQGMKDQWKTLTRPARRSAFTAIADGMKTANALMPMFARNTNQTMGVLQKGVGEWMKGLRSKGGRNALDEMMGNFNKTLAPVMHGLGQIGAYLGRIGQIASRSLPGLAREFSNWGDKINSISTAKLTGQIKGLIQNAKDVGRFFVAAGRLLKTFFAGGVDAGDSFVNTMTDAMDRWTAFLQTTKGQNSLHRFFEQGVKGTQALFSLLAPVIGSFVRWAEVIAPISRLFFNITGALSGFVAHLMSLTALRGPLSGIAATLGLLWGVGKISKAVGAVTAFTRALLGLAGAEKAVAEGGAIMKGAAVVGGVVGRGGATAAEAEGGAQAAAEMRTGIVEGGAEAAAEMRAGVAEGGAAAGAEEGLAGAAGGAAGAGRSFGLLGSAVGAVGTAFGLEGAAAVVATGGLALVAGAAAFAAYKLITMKSASEKLHDSLKTTDAVTSNYNQTTKALVDVMGAAGTATHDYHDDIGRTAALKKRLNKLEAEGKTHTAAYKQTLDALNQSLQQRNTDERNSHKLFAQASKLEQQATTASNRRQTAIKDVSKAQDNYNEKVKIADKAGMRGVARENFLKSSANDLADAKKALARATAAEATAERRAALGQMNYQRGLKGLIPLAGRAATALVNLQKRAPNMAAQINVKYADPKDAGSVARRASAALQSGVKSSIITKIIADSSDAEEAVRRINHQEVKTKVLNIKAKGADVTLAMLARITGHKLSPKTQHILEKGGDAALHKLKEILGFHISDKNFRAWLKTNAPGLLAAIKNGIDSLHDKSITLTTINQVIDRHSGALPGKHPGVTHVTGVRAAGRGPIGRETALVGEGKAHEFIADHRTGAVRKTSGPVIMNLKPSESVIPTEAAHRSKGRALFSQMAKDLGIPGFKGGTHAKKKRAKLPTAINHPTHSKKLRNTGLTTHGRAEQRSTARREATKKTQGHGKSQPFIDEINRRKGLEDDQNFEIGRAEGKLQEPDSFIEVIGRDPQTGDDLYAVNEKKVKDWAAALDGIRAMYDELLTRIKHTEAAIAAASTGIHAIMRKAHANMAVLSGRMRIEQKAKNKKGASKSEQQAAEERYRAIQGLYNDEKKDYNDATADYKTLPGESHDLGQRRETATDSRDQYKNDSAAVQGKADTELAGTVKEPVFTPPQTPLEAAQAAISPLDAEAALAAIGQGINGQPPRSSADIIASRTAADQTIIDTAKTMLTDSDPSNDADAYAAISSAASDMQGLTPDSPAADPSASMAAQYQSLGTARQDLFTNFGSNFAVAANMGRSGGAFAPSSGFAYGPNGAQQSTAPGGGGITFNQTFHQMPDPHGWSQGVAFELKAAL